MSYSDMTPKELTKLILEEGKFRNMLIDYHSQDGVDSTTDVFQKSDIRLGEMVESLAAALEKETHSA